MSRGFTVIELLVVIVVIAIIGGGSYSLYQGRREQALANIIWTDLDAIEGAITNTAKSEGIDTWWTQGELGTGSTNPTLQTIASQVELEKYLAKLPEPADSNLSAYLYDNDGDTYNSTNCSNATYASRGVNLRIRTLNGSRFAKRALEKIDAIHDNNNGNCGKVTITTSGNTTTLYYHIALNSADYPSTID